MKKRKRALFTNFQTVSIGISSRPDQSADQQAEEKTKLKPLHDAFKMRSNSNKCNRAGEKSDPGPAIRRLSFISPAALTS